jgi:serine/threonine protein kinase
MADDPDKVGKLLEEARARPPGQREAFLEEQCEDEALRREIASLLAAYEEAPHLVEGIADAVVDPALSAFEHTQAAARGADPLELVGTQVGRYVVEEVLGGGGMGIVYRAHDQRLDRDVALKFLPPFLVSNPEAEERFVREARAAATLDHPNVTTVHEIGRVPGGEAQGLRFIAMGYYDGETLRDVLDREGPLPLETALDYAAQICEGLQAAHDAGIVHRDVKPANVMITDKGTVKLLDFGLAKAATKTRLTDPEQKLGTAAYMSPEQAEGEKVSTQTDVWAIGVVLYEMLAGERPFEGGGRRPFSTRFCTRSQSQLGPTVRTSPPPWSRSSSGVWKKSQTIGTPRWGRCSTT